MHLLIIGGTRFLGRHIAESALAMGHQVTLFHRGQTNPGLLPEAEHVHGDRTQGFDALAGRTFDAVIDTCGYFPRIVRMSAEALGGQTKQYLFISSVSVYSDLSKPPNEESAVGELSDESIEEITNESYGPLKALCEKVVREVYGQGAIIVRPGLIVGPHDPTDRFTYWPVRLAKGGDVVIADRKDQPVQVIDVRDLAQWCVHLLEVGNSGTFNATGPSKPYSLSQAMEKMQGAINPNARLSWTPTSLLEKHEVQPWSDLPLLLPYDGSMDGMGNVDVSKAVDSGLTFRDVGITALDTLNWWRSEGEAALKGGLTPEREHEILAAVQQGAAL